MDFSFSGFLVDLKVPLLNLMTCWFTLYPDAQNQSMRVKECTFFLLWLNSSDSSFLKWTSTFTFQQFVLVYPLNPLSTSNKHWCQWCQHPCNQSHHLLLPPPSLCHVTNQWTPWNTQVPQVPQQADCILLARPLAEHLISCKKRICTNNSIISNSP